VSVTWPGPTIGFVRHHFLPPSETFIHSSLRALAERAHRVRVLALRRDQAAKFPWDDVTLVGRRDGGSASSPGGPGADRPVRGQAEALLYRAFTWSPSATRWARSVQLVHAHTGNAGVHAAALARRAGRPLVVSFYGKDVTAAVSRTRWNPSYWHYCAAQRWLFGAADRLLVLSQEMRRALIAQGAPEDKLRVVPLGVDLARFAAVRAVRPSAEPLRVLMVGREVEKKGFDDGLRACAAARQAGAALEVTVLGTGGPLRASLQRLAGELALEVAWPDPATRVAAAMAAHDVLLVPSRTAANGDQEGTPTVICEGSAASLAVVATRHAGIPEQVDHQGTGLLADERDVAALAAQLVALDRDRAQLLAFGRAGAVKMRELHGLEAHGARLSAIYGELLSR
jgi:colanic acid/amylovoran biosynthesis glycosyltransferase